MLQVCSWLALLITFHAQLLAWRLRDIHQHMTSLFPLSTHTTFSSTGIEVKEGVFHIRKSAFTWCGGWTWPPRRKYEDTTWVVDRQIDRSRSQIIATSGIFGQSIMLHPSQPWLVVAERYLRGETKGKEFRRTALCSVPGLLVLLNEVDLGRCDRCVLSRCAVTPRERSITYSTSRGCWRCCQRCPYRQS
jgi:hypothetical protein